MGRKLEFCKDTAMERAMMSFWAKGYEATSMRELADTLGLHLGSVYNALGDKEKVFENALRRYLEKHVTPIMTELEKAQDPMRALEDLADRVLEECSGKKPESPGCFFLNSLLSITHINPNITALVRETIETVDSGLANCIRRAQAQGQIPLEKNPAQWARFFHGMLDGMRVAGKFGQSEAHMADIRDCALAALRQ